MFIGTQYVLSLSWCGWCVKNIMCWEWGGTNQSTPCLDIRLKPLHSCGFVSFLPTRWHYSVSAQDISLFPVIARTCSLCLRKTCNTALWFSGERMFFAFRFMPAGLRLRLWTGNGKPMDEWQCRVSLVYSAVTWRCKLTKVQWRRLLWTPVWSQFNSTLKVNHQI